MNVLRSVRALALLVALLWLAGCAGAGPAGSRGSTTTRCGSSAQDDQRPLFFLFCAESP
jgi:hypothetical protein